MIGKGSFARVYYAKKKETEEFFAIKALRKERILKDTNGIENLFNEVKIMKDLGNSNPNLMNFYELHETENSIYMVVEHFAGKELLKRLAKKKNISE